MSEEYVVLFYNEEGKLIEHYRIGTLNDIIVEYADFDIVDIILSNE